MASFNKVIMIGNMVADPELKQTENGIPVTSFSIAVNRSYVRQGEQPQVDFFNVVCWRRNAEFVTKYFSKGKPILICGSLQTRNWIDNNNQKRYMTEIVADEVNFVERKSSEGYSPTSNTIPSYSTPKAEGSFEELSADDELPF